MKPCNNPACSCTTSIAETIEHGWGECSENGFWEHPCKICNRFYERKIVNDAGIVTLLAQYLEKGNGYRFIYGSNDEMYFVYRREFDNYPSDYRVVEWRHGILQIKKICDY